MSEFKKETHIDNFFSLKHRTMSLTLMTDWELKRGSHLYKGNNDANVHLNTEDFLIINSGQLLCKLHKYFHEWFYKLCKFKGKTIKFMYHMIMKNVAIISYISYF